MYRIKIIDDQGGVTYSSIIIVSIKGEESSLTLYPNPTKNLVTLRWDKAVKVGKILLMTSSGTVIKQMPGIASTSVSIDLQQLSKGVYYVAVSEQGKVIEQRTLMHN